MRPIATQPRFFLLALPQSGAAQLSGRQAASRCISVAGTRAQGHRQGQADAAARPRPPNYESIAAGDAEQGPFILELPGGACIDDGGEFAWTVRALHHGDVKKRVQRRADRPARAAVAGAISRAKASRRSTPATMRRWW